MKDNYNHWNEIVDFGNGLIDKSNYNHWHEIIDFDNGLIEIATDLKLQIRIIGTSNNYQ